MPLPNSHTQIETLKFPLYEAAENHSFLENEYNDKNINDLYAKVDKPNKQVIFR